MNLSESIKNVVIALLGIAIGSIAAVSLVGYSSDEHQVLSHHLEEFQKLSLEQQKMLKASATEFSIQTDERRQDIRSLHEAIQSDPELKSGLEKYSAWWSSLSQAEWDSFPAMDREQQIAFVKARINKSTNAEKSIIVDFAGWGQSSLQPLHLTLAECEKIISDSLKGMSAPPEISDDLKALKSSEHRALLRALWMFEYFRENPDRQAMAAQSQKIRLSVLANISDVAWKEQFQQIVEENINKVFLPFWLHRNLLVIMDQSTMALGDRLTKAFPVSEEETVKAFVSIEDKSRQYALMVMPSAEARVRLEFLAQEFREQTPEQKLLIRFIAFARERQRIIGALTFGLGNREPPGRDGNSPPRHPDEK